VRRFSFVLLAAHEAASDQSELDEQQERTESHDHERYPFARLIRPLSPCWLLGH